MSRRRSRGVALVMVLLLMTMAVLIAADIMERLEQDRTRTGNLLVMEQSWAYLLSAEGLAIRALSSDLAEDRRKNREADGCSEETWARQLGPVPWEGAIITLTIQDLQGRLNINGLAASKDGERTLDRVQVERLKRLLGQLLPSEDAAAAATLAEEAADWTDGNTLVDGLGGAEDTEYEDRRTGNTFFAEVSELRALRGATAAPWQASGDKPLFSRYITALPEGTRVNVNTAPVEVLKALSASLDGTRADAILKAREKEPLATVEAVMALPELAGLGANEKKELQNSLAVNSEYFQVTADVTVDGRALRLVSDVYRPHGGGAPQVIRRDLGQGFAPRESACNPGNKEQAQEKSA